MTPRRATAPLRRQLVLTTSGLTAAAMLLVVVIVQLVVHRVIDHNLDEVLRERVATTQTLFEESETNRGGSGEPDEIGEGVAVFGPDGILIRGALPRAAQERARQLATTTVRRNVEVGEQVRLLAVPFRFAGEHAVIIAAESVVPYEQAESYALVVTVGLGLLTVVGVALVTAWTVRRSLAPVAAMAATADDWSVHDLNRRFDLGPPSSEITALGATLDRLLDRVARALLAEQRLTAEVAHEIRTPLTAVVGAADVALLRRDLDPHSREAFEQISESAHRMADTVTALVDLARATSDSLGESCTLGEVVDALDLSDVECTVTPDQRGLALGLPAALAVRAVTPVLDNARAHRSTAVRLSVRLSGRTSGPTVDVLVDDDGEGIGDQDASDIFRPGVRSSVSAGAGLGLPLARRVARAAGGDVLWEPTGAGARFVIRLPMV